jgi:Cytochrome P460
LIKKTHWTALLMIAVALVIQLTRLGLPEEVSGVSPPQYTSDGKLVRPQHYREWIYLSSGLGMNYGPVSHDAPAFTNVFVAPAAYKHYMSTGQWLDKTIFVLEVYSASSHGSIVKQGQFQDALLSVEAEVKDESRYPEKWAYFGFGIDGKTASKISQDHCWSCHNQNAAVENSFVQFYPTLLKVAYEKHTIKPSVHASARPGGPEPRMVEP